MATKIAVLNDTRIERGEFPFTIESEKKIMDCLWFYEVSGFDLVYRYDSLPKDLITFEGEGDEMFSSSSMQLAPDDMAREYGGADGY